MEFNCIESRDVFKWCKVTEGYILYNMETIKWNYKQLRTLFLKVNKLSALP